MTEAELRDKLIYLINKYVSENERELFYDDISREGIPVKNILANFNKVKMRTVEQVDGELIRNIYFYFC